MYQITFMIGADYFWNTYTTRLVGVLQLGSLLLMVNKFVGRDQIDWIVLGLSSLLSWSFQILKSLGKPLEAPYVFQR